MKALVTVERSDGLEHASHADMVGIDAGKGRHWAVGVDADGETLFSTKVINDEAEILTLVETASERADEVRWAVAISGRACTLLVALLIVNDQQVVHMPGRTVIRVSGAYRGEGRTDAKDARVIADQARMRQDFAPPDTPPGLVSALQVVTNYRADLIADRVQLINRSGTCSWASARCWSEPSILRGEGPGHHVDRVPDPGHPTADRRQAPDSQRDHRVHAGMGPILGAEFVAIVGDLSGYRDAGRLASHAGLAPVARDSGRRTGSYRRPKRHNRRLRHAFYLAAPNGDDAPRPVPGPLPQEARRGAAAHPGAARAHPPTG
jgi:transposase